MLGRIVANRKGVVAAGDSTFRELCHDVLNADCLKVTRDGQVAGLERLDDIITRCCPPTPALVPVAGEKKTASSSRRTLSLATEAEKGESFVVTDKRGVQQIKTMGGIVDVRRIRSSSGALLELSMLEMEKQRLIKEMLRSEQRCVEIRGRMAEIETKQARLQQFVDKPHGRCGRTRRSRPPRRFRSTRRRPTG